MNPSLYYSAFLESSAQLLCIFIVILIFNFILNKLILKTVINGMLTTNFAATILLAIIIDLYISDNISFGKVVHFIMTQYLVYVFLLFYYKKFVDVVIKNNIISILSKISWKAYITLVSSLLVIAVFIYFNTQGGGSRIAYQTQRWFSFFRIYMFIVIPLSYIIFIYYLFNKKFFRGILLLVTIAMLTIVSGSKASFILVFTQFLLLYRDFTKYKLRLKKRILVLALIAVAGLVYLNLHYLDVDLHQLGKRVIYYGEATIMIYPLEDPESIFQDISMIARIHRGVGRLLGDASSLDPDALFGYAILMNLLNGGINTFTGPNASLGAYALAVFPGFYVIIFYLVFILFYSFIWYVFKANVKNNDISALIIACLLFQAITVSFIGYNYAMSYFTLFVCIAICLYIFKRLKHKMNITDGNEAGNNV